MGDDAAYDPYELLDILIDRVAWSNSQQAEIAHRSVQRWRDVNLFGNYALIVKCSHEIIERRYREAARCQDCGKVMT